MREESRRAHLLHQSAADGILVRVVRVGKTRRGPVLCRARELRVPRLEEGPIQMREPVHEPQSPSKTGFCFATKASYARRKSRVCMQIVCALASIPIASSRPTA